MASSGKRTTTAKINRENAVRERSLHRQVRKAARKLEAAGGARSRAAAIGPARRET
jgi:hypothetical protein